MREYLKKTIIFRHIYFILLMFIHDFNIRLRAEIRLNQFHLHFWRSVSWGNGKMRRNGNRIAYTARQKTLTKPNFTLNCYTHVYNVTYPTFSEIDEEKIIWKVKYDQWNNALENASWIEKNFQFVGWRIKKNEIKISI